MFAKRQRIHCIGIGGIGMSGIAEILLTLGYAVSGSDLKRSAATERLTALGATIFEGHAAAHIEGCGVVVASSAIQESNPEMREARERKIPVIPRAEMLAELMRIKYGIAVAGMHGKTTTTSMIATVLAAGGLDPTVVAGGRINAYGSNAFLGGSRYLVAEADESDRSFLKLSPILSVVTNLDREHMDCYRDMEDVNAAFIEFMDRVPFYGATTACLDDPRLAAILPRVDRRVFTYGFSPEADYSVRLLPPKGEVRCRFEVATEGGVAGPLELRIPGRHNVLNATAAVAIAAQLEIGFEAIAEGLRNYRGVGRRFEHKGMIGGVAVVDDYGHHPAEILATLRAARDFGYSRVHIIFQPHRFTRTRDLLEEFGAALREADTVEIVDIYPASEMPIAGIDANAVVRAAARASVVYADGFEEAAERAAERACEGDVILTLGAGNVSQAAGLALDALRRREEAAVRA